jgi:hypothetical protein
MRVLPRNDRLKWKFAIDRFWHKCEVPRLPLYSRFRRISGSEGSGVDIDAVQAAEVVEGPHPRGTAVRAAAVRTLNRNTASIRIMACVSGDERD